MAAAYAVQERVTAARTAAGATVVGHKIGLTSPAVQHQLGVDRPDFGLLFDDMGYPEAAEVRIERLLQPKVEAEIAFVLAHDLVDGPLDVEHVRGAAAHAVAALEIVDSRLSNWDITFGDTVADGAGRAFSALAVVGFSGTVQIGPHHGSIPSQVKRWCTSAISMSRLMRAGSL